MSEYFNTEELFSEFSDINLEHEELLKCNESLKLTIDKLKQENNLITINFNCKIQLLEYENDKLKLSLNSYEDMLNFYKKAVDSKGQKVNYIDENFKKLIKINELEENSFFLGKQLLKVNQEYDFLMKEKESVRQLYDQLVENTKEDEQFYKAELKRLQNEQYKLVRSNSLLREEKQALLKESRIDHFEENKEHSERCQPFVKSKDLEIEFEKIRSEAESLRLLSNKLQKQLENKIKENKLLNIQLTQLRSLDSNSEFNKQPCVCDKASSTTISTVKSHLESGFSTMGNLDDAGKINYLKSEITRLANLVKLKDSQLAEFSGGIKELELYKMEITSLRNDYKELKEVSEIQIQDLQLKLVQKEPKSSRNVNAKPINFNAKELISIINQEDTLQAEVKFLNEQIKINANNHENVLKANNALIHELKEELNSKSEQMVKLKLEAGQMSYDKDCLIAKYRNLCKKLKVEIGQTRDCQSPNQSFKKENKTTQNSAREKPKKKSFFNIFK